MFQYRPREPNLEIREVSFHRCRAVGCLGTILSSSTVPRKEYLTPTFFMRKLSTTVILRQYHLRDWVSNFWDFQKMKFQNYYDLGHTWMLMPFRHKNIPKQLQQFSFFALPYMVSDLSVLVCARICACIVCVCKGSLWNLVSSPMFLSLTWVLPIRRWKEGRYQKPKRATSLFKSHDHRNHNSSSLSTYIWFRIQKAEIFSLVMQMATHPSKVCDMKQENTLKSIQTYSYCCLGVCGPIVDIQLRSLGFLLQAMSWSCVLPHAVFSK